MRPFSPDLVEWSDHIACSQDVAHVLTGEGQLIRQVQEPTKLHPPLDALDGVRIQVGESLRLKKSKQRKKHTAVQLQSMQPHNSAFLSLTSDLYVARREIKFCQW